MHNADLRAGARCCGFRLERREHLDEIRSEVFLFVHEVLGCQALAIKNSDPNKTFCISFRTVPADSTGVAHILEHSVLMGSQKYPVRDVFGEIHKGGLLTFLNAMTGPDATYYPFATRNLHEYFSIMDVYCDVTLHPLLAPTTFAQEGWRLHLEDESGTPQFRGVVFNEMKGAFADPLRTLVHDVYKGLLPGSTHAHESGGDPACIPDLSYEQFCAFHARHYHPSNATLFFYGDAPLEEELARVQDKALSAFSAPGPVATCVQGTVPAETVSMQDSYPVAGGDTQDKTFLALASVVGSAQDREKSLAFELLSGILFNSDASPLKNAIVSSGLGKDFGGLFMADAGYATLMLVYLIGSEPERADSFFALCRSSIQEIVRQGLDPELVLSELNAFEFRLREEMNKPQRGLHLILRAQEAMKQGISPFVALQLNGLLAQVRQKALHEGWLEQLMQRHLLNNPHTLELTLTPDPEGMESNRKREQDQAARMSAHLDQKARQALVQQAADLERLQTTPSTAAELACLPRLTLAELDRRPPLPSLREEALAGCPLLVSETETSGIVYLSLGFDCSALNLDDLLLLDLFGVIVTELGTADRDYRRFAAELNICTGGLEHSFQVYVQAGDCDQLRPMFWLHVKALSAFLPRALDLLTEVLTGTDFSDQRRIEEIVRREFAWAEQNVQSEGYSLAAQRAFAHVSRAGKYGDAVQGIAGYLRLKDLAANYAAQEGAFLAALKRIKAALFRKPGLVCSLTADSPEVRRFCELGPALLRGLGEDVIPACQPNFAALPASEAFQTAAEITYNIQVCRLFAPGQYQGDFEVLKTWLSRDYLWNTVRQQGGAYGCFIQFNHVSGNFGLVSYRDPQVAQTYRTYAELPPVIAGLDLSRPALEQLIIGAYAGVNPHQGPAGRAALARDRYLSGVTPEFLEQRLDRLLGATLQGLQGYADFFAELVKNPVRVSIGDGDKLRQDSGLFASIREL